MKIAIVISGLARFPEQGFHFLKKILDSSPYKIDVYAGLWSIDTLPENISKELKAIKVIPYSIRDELIEDLRKNNLIVDQLNSTFLNNHSGLIGHMETCNLFSKELINYDFVFKWRWDVVVTLDHFEMICKNLKKFENFFISDLLTIDEGNTLMNEVVFVSTPKLMLNTFTPTKEKFLELGKALDRDKSELDSDKLRLGSLSSFTKLIILNRYSVRTVPFSWALLRKNILDNQEYLNYADIRLLIKLQQEGDFSRDLELLKSDKK